MEFLKSHPVDPIEVASFEASCGVGVVVTKEEIADKVRRAGEVNISAKRQLVNFESPMVAFLCFETRLEMKQTLLQCWSNLYSVIL